MHRIYQYSLYDKLTRECLRVLSENTEIICCMCEVRVGEKSFIWTGSTEGQIAVWRTDKDKGKVQPVKLQTHKQKQSLINNWQQLKSIIANINAIGASDEPQQVYNAISALDKIMSNF